jgi:hypothetical protein
MSNNKQTSVDQLFDQLSSEGLLGLFTFDQMKRALEILDEAKAMHKEEIEKAWKESRLTHPMIGFKHETFDKILQRNIRR